MYGTPSDDFLSLFSDKVVALHPPYSLPEFPQQGLLVLHDLHYTRLPCDAFFEAAAAKRNRFLLLPAVPCRETLRLLLNTVVSLQGMPQLEEDVHDLNLAAAMRGYVGVVYGNNLVPEPFRYLTPDYHVLYPYPPLLKNDLVVETEPAFFQVFTVDCVKDPHAKLKHLVEHLRTAEKGRTIIVAESDSADLRGAIPNVTFIASSFEVDEKNVDRIVVMTPPPDESGLVYLLSRLNPGGEAILYGTYLGPTGPESEDLYKYRWHESDLLHALLLIQENSIPYFGDDHSPMRYLVDTYAWRQEPSIVSWVQDLFRNKPVVPVREVQQFVRQFEPLADVNAIVESFSFSEVVDHYGTKGRAVLWKDLLVFQPTGAPRAANEL
jgi:hypothetical protein